MLEMSGHVCRITVAHCKVGRARQGVLLSGHHVVSAQRRPAMAAKPIFKRVAALAHWANAFNHKSYSLFFTLAPPPQRRGVGYLVFVTL
jgi:hypothetical protein